MAQVFLSEEEIKYSVIHVPPEEQISDQNEHKYPIAERSNIRSQNDQISDLSHNTLVFAKKPEAERMMIETERETSYES